MTSIRISKYAAEKAVKAMLMDAKGKEALVVATRLKVTSHALMDLWLGNKNVKLLETLPDGWVPSVHNQSVRAHGQRMTAYFGLVMVASGRVPFKLENNKPLLPDYRRVPLVKRHEDIKFKDGDGMVVEEFTDAYHANCDFGKMIDGLYDKSLATCMAFTMTGVLFDHWPEIAKYWPQPEAAQASRLLPAAIPQLNAAIGLPV